MYTIVLFFVVMEYTLLWSILAQDIVDPSTACERTKFSCSLYAKQQNRLTDLEAKLQEMTRKLDSLNKPQNLRTIPIAFTAKKSQTSTDKRGTIIFEDAMLNQGGHYNSTSGKFIAPVNGIYVFSWTIVTEQTYAVGSELMLNGNRVAYGWTDARLSPGNRDDSGSNTITLKLNRGDTVSVDIGSGFDTYVSGGGWSSFTGWKIYDVE